MKKLIALGFLLAVITSAPAAILLGPMTSGSPQPSPACPQGTAFADGCPLAPGNGSFQQANFFTFARQSGQTFATRPPWNVAGVDYKVGYDTTLTLKDPSTASLPTGAVYHASGPNFIGPYVEITGANVTLSGYDLSLHGGISLSVLSTASGTFTLDNCKFIAGTNQNSNTDWFDVSFTTYPGGPNIVVQYCDMDFQGLQGNQLTTRGFSFWGSGTVLLQYNRIANANIRNTFGQTQFIAQFNYWDSQHVNGPAHGEWTLFNDVLSNNQTLPLVQLSYNTALQQSMYGGGMTAIFYASSGNQSLNLTITNVQFDHNTCVINYFLAAKGYISGTTLTVTDAGLSDQLGATSFLGTLNGVTAAQVTGNGTGTGGTGTYTINVSQTVGSAGSPIALPYLVVSAGLFEIAHDVYGTVTAQNNYIDATGSFFKTTFTGTTMVNTPTYVQSGNIDLKTGSATPVGP